MWGSIDSKLLKAMRKGEASSVHSLLKQGAGIGIAYDHGLTPLHWAVRRGDKEVAQLAVSVDKGWVHARTDDGRTALMSAVTAAVGEARHLPIIKLLIGGGADINAKDSGGANALLMAVETAAEPQQSGLVKLLIDGGADINAHNSGGFNALMLAVEAAGAACRAELVELLIASGIDKDARGAGGTTALMYAVDQGQSQIVDSLVRHGADINLGNADGFTPLRVAATIGNTGIAKRLLEAGADANARLPDGTTALMSAVKNRDLPMVQLLLEAGTDVDAEDNDGFTALMAAAGLASTKFQLHDGGLRVDNDLTAATVSASAELTRSLLAAGADKNKTHRILGTALHIAVFRNHLVIVSELLINGANPNARNPIGESPLWNAVMKPERIDALKLLLNHGADPNARDSRSHRVFLLAVTVGSVDAVEQLIASGADITGEDPGGWTALTLADKRKDARMLDLLRSSRTR